MGSWCLIQRVHCEASVFFPSMISIKELHTSIHFMLIEWTRSSMLQPIDTLDLNLRRLLIPSEHIEGSIDLCLLQISPTLRWGS